MLQPRRNPLTQLSDSELKQLSIPEFVQMLNAYDAEVMGPDMIPTSADKRDWPKHVRNGYDAMAWIMTCESQYVATKFVPTEEESNINED